LNFEGVLVINNIVIGLKPAMVEVLHADQSRVDKTALPNYLRLIDSRIVVMRVFWHQNPSIFGWLPA